MRAVAFVLLLLLIPTPAAAWGLEAPKAILDSFKLAESVLQSDRKAAQGRELYDDGYFAVLAKEQLGVLEKRLNDATPAVASLVIGAWEHAGRPAVPVERVRQPQPIRKP